MNRVKSTRRKLGTLSGEPFEARHLLVATLRDLVPADFGLEYRAAPTPSGDWVASADGVIDGEDWRAPFAEWAGARLDLRQHSFHPELPARAEANRFVSIQPEHRRAASYHRYYAPNGLKQLRALCYDGGRFLGWVGLLRNADCPPFTAAERRSLDALVPSITCSLAALHRTEEAELEGVAPAHILYSPDGRLSHATDAVAEWLTSRRSRFLSDFVRTADRGGVATTALDGAELGVRRLVGDRTVYLVNLGRAKLPRRSLLATMTARRREIAEYAAAGATAKETAETLGISAHTVRQHLKVVYRELGVGSRVELARLLEEGAES